MKSWKRRLFVGLLLSAMLCVALSVGVVAASFSCITVSGPFMDLMTVLPAIGIVLMGMVAHYRFKRR